MNYKQIIKQINALQFNKKPYIFKKEQFEKLENTLFYDNLVVLNSIRNSAFCLDEKLPFEVIHQQKQAEFLGYKESFLSLGIDLIAFILEQKQLLEINLTHSKSKIKKLFFYLEKNAPIDESYDFLLKYDYSLDLKAFEYFPQKIQRHPFASFSSRAPLQESHRPAFYYAWENSEENLTQTTPPDYIVIQAPLEGMIALAQMFLDFGKASNEIDELNLETSLFGGYEGSRLGSIETRFFLPNSFGFPENNLDDVIS